MWGHTQCHEFGLGVKERFTRKVAFKLKSEGGVGPARLKMKEETQKTEGRVREEAGGVQGG